MSSTQRGYERHKTDYYVTPEQPVRNFLRRFIGDEGIDISSMDILDPCAGGDKRNDMTYPSALFYAGANYDKIVTNDIRDDSGAKYKHDFLADVSIGNFDMIISNPPFLYAQEFIRRGLEMVNDGGYVIMLLRLNFFGSKKRFPLFQNNKPTHCYVHSKRMSFTDDGKTDSIEYAHFIWKKGANPCYTKTIVI